MSPVTTVGTNLRIAYLGVGTQNQSLNLCMHLVTEAQQPRNLPFDKNIIPGKHHPRVGEAMSDEKQFNTYF
jgi:hypothetical protein